MFRPTENEKSDVASAGPVARAMDTVICEIPFVVPSEFGFGDDDVM